MYLSIYLIYNLRERSHNRSLITKTTYLNEHDFFYTDFVQKLLLIDPLMCVAVVALSYFTFIFYYFYRFLLFSCVLSTPNKVHDYDDDRCLLLLSHITNVGLLTYLLQGGTD